MNIHPMIIAVENLELAITMTPEREEREELEKVIEALLYLLQKRGVFLGRPCREHPCQIQLRMPLEG